MQGAQETEKGGEVVLAMAEQIAVLRGQNDRFGEIAALLKKLLQPSKEEKEELQRLRKIEDELRSREIELKAKLQAKDTQLAEKEAGFRNKMAILQENLNEEKDKLDAATQSIEAYKQKIDELAQQNTINLQELEKQLNELSQNQKTAEESWTMKYQKLKMRYTQLLAQATKHQQTFKEMDIYKLRMEADQRSTKDKYEKEQTITKAQFQKEKIEQQKRLREEQANSQRLKTTIKQHQGTIQAQRKNIDELTVQNSKQAQNYRSIVAKMQSLTIQYKEKIASETTKLNDLYLGKIDTISRENQKTMSQIKTSYNQSIDKQNQIHLKEVSKLNEQVRTLKEENESNSRSNASEITRLQQSFEAEKQELIDMLISIYLVVFGKTFEVIENQQITKSVQKKYNDLTSKIADLEQINEQSTKQCKSLHSQLSQVKKFLNIFSIKLNNPEILEALNQLDALKPANFVFSDQDLIESVAAISKRLLLRLKDCKEQMNNLEKEKGELFSQQYESNSKAAESQKRIESLEGRLKKEEEHCTKLIAEHKDNEGALKAQKLTMQGSIDSLNETVDKLSKQIASSKQQVGILSQTVRKQNDELHSFSQQNGALKDLLSFEASRNQRNTKEISQLQQQKQDLSKENIQLLSSSESLSSQIYSLKTAMSQQQQQHEAWRRKQIDQINAFISNQYESRAQLDSFEAFLHFLKINQSSSEVTPFTVSHIFERAAKERQILIAEANKFLKTSLSSTTLLYKYDEFNKNFSNYLPIQQQYSFLILAKTKKLQIFGVLSIGLGRGSKSLAFNLTEPKFFESNPNNASSNYDGGYLIFGQGEIRFRNNSSLQAVVNSRIFGARHFTFKKDELVGKNEDGDSVQLQAIQIHRLNY